MEKGSNPSPGCGRRMSGCGPADRFRICPVSAAAARTSRHPAGDGISGRFYGPDHEEVGGLFGRREVMPGGQAAAGVRAEVSGAFGARRE